MAEGRAQGQVGARAGGRVGGRVGTWPGIAGAAPWRLPQAGLAGPFIETLRSWAAAELAPGRLMPWLPDCAHKWPFCRPFCASRTVAVGGTHVTTHVRPGVVGRAPLSIFRAL